MNTVQEESKDGDYISYKEHEEVVARLKEDIEALKRMVDRFSLLGR